MEVNEQNPSEVVKTEQPEVPVAETKPEPSPEERQKLEQQRKLFQEIRRGALFFRYIYQDIEKQKRKQMNRVQRRRFEKELKKGIVSKELVDVYASQIDVILEWMDSQLNPKPKSEPIDGSEFYKNLKEQEAKNELPEQQTEVS